MLEPERTTEDVRPRSSHDPEIHDALLSSSCPGRPSGQHGTTRRSHGRHAAWRQRLKRLHPPGGLEIWCSQNPTLPCGTARSDVGSRRPDLTQSALTLDVTWFDPPGFKASANGRATPSRDCCTAGQGRLQALLSGPSSARTLASGPWPERWIERWILLWITLWISGRL